jgi:hypothetical protein
MTTPARSYQCEVCAHYRHAKYDPWRLCCDAFPDGIPREIRIEQHDHRKPFPGDNGILFEPKPGEEIDESLFPGGGGNDD